MKDPSDTYLDIEAVEYEKTCGHTELGTGIAMMGTDGRIFCQMEQGTIAEKDFALLWQAAPALFGWALEACEQTRAAGLSPIWLENLEAAIKYARGGPLKD